LEESKLKDIITRHSQFVGYPIEMMVEKEKEVEVEADADSKDDADADADADKEKEDNADVDADKTEDNADADDEVKVEDVDEDEDKESKPKTEKVKYKDWEHLNKQKPIWTRSKDDVTEDEYKEFYKSITKDHDESLSHLHFKVEGNIEFSSILFLPNRAPFDMFGGGGADKAKNNVKLYVKRVFIMDDCKELVPEWLSFVKGVVDCKDLPLNVSRELLQQNRTLKVINKQVVKKTIEMLTSLAEDKPDDYKTFYEHFNKNLKLGIHEDEKNRVKLSKLLRYNSLNHRDEQISLEQYVEEMKEDQKDIYYIGGESVKAVENSPFLEQLKAKGFDVLFYTDPIDEYVSQQMKEFEEKKLVSASSKSLKLDNDEEEEKKLKEEFDGLAKRMKEVLADKVQAVTVSTRVVDSPSCLVTDDQGYSANMQRIMKAQAMNNNQMMQFMMGRKDMEINPKHKIVKELNKRFVKDKEDPIIKDLTTLLYDMSLLTSGFTIEDPSVFAQRFNKMISLGLSIDDDDVEEDDDLEELVELDEDDTNAVDKSMEQVD